MILYGIDPGTKESALAILNLEGRNLHSVELKHLPNQLLEQMIMLDHANHLVYEWIQNYGRVVGEETLKTAYWCGRFACAAELVSTTVTFAKRPDIVLHFTGQRNNPKANVRQAVLDRFGGACAKKKGGILHGISNHMWDALAIAMYELEVNNVCKPEDWSTRWVDPRF